MGHRNFDRWPAEAWRRSAETVGRMRANGWDVIAYCRVCNLTVRVDLSVIEALRGPHLALWNRQGKCRRLGCEGLVEFQGRPPELYRHFPLRAEWPKP